MFDRYKLDQLDLMLSDLQNNGYALARLKSDSSKAINLDEGALNLLIDYYSGKITACDKVTAGNLVGRNSDRFEIQVYDPDMYDDIMEAIDDCCSSSMGELYYASFIIKGPEEEKYDVTDILNEFGVDWEEI